MSAITTFTSKDFKILSRELLYQSFFCLTRYTIQHRLFDGSASALFTRDLVERKGAACILPYNIETDKVVLIEQFRIGCIKDPHSPWQIEIPAGILEGNENPTEVAIREAKEEANCHIKALHKIVEFYASPGGSNEYVTLYCGKIDESNLGGIYGLKEENEDIKVHYLYLDAALEKLYAGQIKNAPTIMALLWLQLHKSELKSAWQ